VYLYLHSKGFEVEIDHSNITLNNKIRRNQLAQWNYILVCGEEEVKSGCVDVRTRENVRQGKMRVDKVAEFFESLLPKKSPEFDSMYSKAWKAEDYPVVEGGEQASS